MTRKFLEKQLIRSKAGKAYLRLISKALSENYNIGKKRVEVHHIVPRCLWGSNEPENLVPLTVYDHILAHYYLACALGDQKISLRKAFGCMCNWHLPSLSELEQVKLEQLEEWGKLRDISKKHSETTKIKISKATKGKQKVRIQPVLEETRKKISEYQKGKPKSEEHKKHISEAKVGKPGTFKGKHHSVETKEKMKVARIGKPGSFTGKHHSVETKEKMRQSHLGKKLSIEDRLHKSEAQKKRWEKIKNSK